MPVFATRVLVAYACECFLKIQVRCFVRSVAVTTASTTRTSTTADPLSAATLTSTTTQSTTDTMTGDSAEFARTLNTPNCWCASILNLAQLYLLQLLAIFFRLLAFFFELLAFLSLYS